ncbi:TMV resistance protein N-like [Malus domestica]|uniref:TMV resistance protein N-like n=1 Tax=Malus domestica TaxID=3750 RepID=UPI003975F966
MAAFSPSSSSEGRWKYDVFLNFRGEDTRKIFVGHLYKALDQKAINTFIDAEELRKGNDLSELLTALSNSRLSIVVFSENYASSTWCLKELVQIMECMDTHKQIVVPVFYQVNPSDIRKLEGSFAEAFAKHEHHSNVDVKEVQSWRSALARATDLSGWDSQNYKDDAKLIEDIVDDIFNKLIHVSSSKDNGLVGMDYHIDEMNLLLRPGVNDVFAVGIWGMGGIGKTTIARAVYDEIACQFEACCFLENVKEGFSNKGAVHMQEVLLSRILKEKMRSLGTLDRGSKMIMERLRRKKVFIVLDDVDKLSQIEDLLGKQHSFGGGSRIIITTRDMQLLSGVDAVYKPKNLSEPEALELFRQYAFRTNQSTTDYDRLSRLALQHAHGVPLALKILGALLDNRSVREWEDVLKKTKKTQLMGIQDVLRKSFDGLDDSEKDIFLDIACFFKGMEKDYVTKILDSCGFYPHSGLGVLVNRTLITISDYDTLEMHDLLQEMGWEIVRQESNKEYGRRSRLWIYEDVHRALTQNTATEAVEGITLDLANSEEVYFETEAFVRMKKLRLLKIHCSRSVVYASWEHLSHPNDDCKQHMSGDLKFLSHELRCLLWHGCPLKSLPSNFHPKNLIDLEMPYSQIEQLWEGTEHLEMLEVIDLRHSQYLNKTPDITEAKNLEILNLEGCTSLTEVHPSSRIHMKSLKTLVLSGCSNLVKFPEISGSMQELSELYLDQTAIEELPSSIRILTGLVTLNLKRCRELKSLPSSICQLKSLRYLTLSGCPRLKEFPEIEEDMEGLRELHLDGTSITRIFPSIERLQGLVILNLKNCKSIVCLPDSICNLAYLTRLTVSGCSRLCHLPEGLGNVGSLRDIDVKGSGLRQPFSMSSRLLPPRLLFPGWKKMKAPFLFSQPSIWVGEYYKILRQLDLSDCKLLRLPDVISVLSQLVTLILCRNNFESLPATLDRLHCLRHLNVEACRRLKSIPQLSLSIKDVDAHDCTALETVSTPNPHDCNALETVSIPKPHNMNLYFTFSNCLQLVQRNPFRDIMETLSHHQGNQLQLLSFNMSLPGSEIPDWFSHQCMGSSVTLQLPLNYYHNKVLGFAICAVSKFRGAHYCASDLSVRCFCTFKGDHGDFNYNFYMVDWGSRVRFLDSDHIFLGYVPWSKCTLIETGKLPSKHCYTEATFKIVVKENGAYASDFRAAVRYPSIGRVGLHFIYANHETDSSC